jgi:predicted DNA-binding protein
MTTASIARPASIRLSARLNGALNAQAKALKISKDTLVRRAIADMLEDMQDLRDAQGIMADIKSGKKQTVTLASMLKRHAL